MLCKLMFNFKNKMVMSNEEYLNQLEMIYDSLSADDISKLLTDVYDKVLNSAANLKKYEEEAGTKADKVKIIDEKNYLLKVYEIHKTCMKYRKLSLQQFKALNAFTKTFKVNDIKYKSF
jgi:hypothetical protein